MDETISAERILDCFTYGSTTTSLSEHGNTMTITSFSYPNKGKIIRYIENRIGKYRVEFQDKNYNTYREEFSGQIITDEGWFMHGTVQEFKMEHIFYCTIIKFCDNVHNQYLAYDMSPFLSFGSVREEYYKNES